MKQLFRDSTFAIIFFLFCLVSLIPLFASHFFVSLDGPSHLYNAQLMNELWKENSFTAQFFQWNSFPPPNSLGHWLLQILLLVFPGFLAEKIFVALLILAFPFAGVKLISLSPERKWLVFLFFPLSFSVFLSLGFYNFLLACILLLLLIVFILKDRSNWNIKSSIALFVLWTALYFSHLVLFGLGLISVFVWLILKTVHEHKSVKVFFKQSLLYFIPAIPVLVLAFIYNTNQSYSDAHYLSLTAIGAMFSDVYLLKSYAYGEYLFNGFYEWILLLGLIVYVWFRFKGRKDSMKILFFKFLFIVLLMLILVFPDSTYSAGFLTSRLCFLGLICIVCILIFSTIPFPKWILVVFLLVIHLKVNFARFQSIKDHAKQDSFMLKAQKLIETNSTLLELNFNSENGGHWMEGHYVCRLAQDGTVIILNNYEAIQSYFPIQWKDKGIIFDITNNPSNLEFEKLKPDYLFSRDYSDASAEQLIQINMNYSKLIQSENFVLLKRKNK